MTQNEFRSGPSSPIKSSPLLSVIITCYNYSNYVCLAIDSIIEQGCNFIEVVVVDDGSTDDSWKKIAQYGDLVKALRISNCGALKASLRGFEISSGIFVYFLDADDLSLPGALNSIYPFLIDGVVKIQFPMVPIDGAGKIIGSCFPPLGEETVSSALIESIIKRGYYTTPPTSGNVYRRDVYESLGDLSYERAIDGVPYLLAPFMGDVVTLGTPLASYRIHDKNLSAFSNLSAVRMRGYAMRFKARLDHLEAILISRKHPLAPLNLSPIYYYFLEMNIYGLVLDRERPPIRLLWSSWRQAMAENPILGGIGRCIFLLVVAAFPYGISKRLIRFRIDQSYFPKVRRILKAKFSGW